MLQIRNPLHLPLLILFLLLPQSSPQLGARILMTPTTIGLASNHELTLLLSSQPIDAGSFVLLQYSSNWLMTGITGGNLTGDYCQTGCTIGSITLTTDATARTVRINGLFPGAVASGQSLHLRYTLKNFINPNFVVSETVTVSLLDSSLSLLDLTTAPIATTPRTFTCTSSRLIPTVSAPAEYQLAVDPNSYSLPASTSILMTFPGTWYNSAQSGTFNTSTFACRSALNPSIACVRAGNVVTVSNVLVAATTALFRFNVSNVINPGSEGVNNELSLGFVVGGRQVGGCVVPITGITAKGVAGFTIGLSGGLGSSFTTEVRFQITQSCKISDLVRIDLPKNYDLSQLLTGFVFLNNETVGREVSMTINTSAPALSTITLTPFFTDSIGVYRVLLFVVGLPRTSAPMPATTLSIVRHDALVATQTCCATTLAPLGSTLGGLSVQLSTRVVGATATHYVSIDGSTLAFANDFAFFLLQLDSKYSLASPTYPCRLTGTLMLIPALTCTRNSSSSLLVSGFNSSTISTIGSSLQQSARLGTRTYTLTVDSITLPVSLASLSAGITTLDNNYFPIETKTTTYTLQATRIIRVTVVTGSTVTYASTYYGFVVENSNDVGAGSRVVIVFPQEISVSAVGVQCWVNSTLVTGANCVIDASTRTITVALANAGVIGSSQLINTNISVSGVGNPLWLRRTGTFQLSIINSNGEVTEGLTEGIALAMTIPNSTLPGLLITPADMTTLAVTRYTLNYRLPLDIVAIYSASSAYITGGTYLRVTLPGEYTCTGCNQSISLILDISNSTSSTSTNTVTLPSITNPEASTISSPIAVEVYLGGYVSIRVLYTALTAFSPGVITYALRQSSYALGERTTIYIDNIEVGVGGYVGYAGRRLVVVPATGYTVDNAAYPVSITCNYINASTSTSISGSTLSAITLDNLPLTRNLSLTLANITNPTALTPGTWSLQLRTLANTLIAASVPPSEYSFTLTCTLPCRSCLPSNTTHCTTCYSNIPTILQHYLDEGAGACVPACSARQYTTLVPNDMQCYACSVQCYTCANVSTNCTACSGLLYLYQPLHSCVLDCPLGYYSHAVTNRCRQCVAPCLYCSGAEGATCQLCQPTHVLTLWPNGTTPCSLGCPAGYYNHSYVCVGCPGECQQCVATRLCTACVPSHYLYNGLCLNQCPRGAYMGGNATCQACQPPCRSCSGYSDYCASCDTSPNSTTKYLHSAANSSTCLPQCPNAYYPDQNSLCLKCISPCLWCESPITCTVCEAGYYLLAAVHACYAVCPNNTILVNAGAMQQCQKCASPCLQCAGAVTTCTSCVELYFLNEISNICVINCTLPFFAINRRCRRCAEVCLTCLNLQPYKCTSCVPPLLLLGSSCHSTCPDGTYQLASTCAICTSGCLTCSNSSSLCLSCLPGLYLYMNSCLPSCPSTPTYYYQYQMQCIPCQPQCSTCISTPIECASCANPAMHFNQVTRECTPGCTAPYYPGSIGTQLLCIKCRQPCKQCTTSYNRCLSCYNGRFLHEEGCLEQCPSGMYESVGDNRCMPCTDGCLQCTSPGSCRACRLGLYNYRGACYSVCPAQAPYPYLSQYCRNCAMDHCLLCDQGAQQQTCLLCQPDYYLFNSQCISECPADYEPDSVTSSQCISTEESALLGYWGMLEKFKVYLMPATMGYLGGLLVVLGYVWGLGGDAEEKGEKEYPFYVVVKQNVVLTNCLYMLVGIPQTVSLLAYLGYNLSSPALGLHNLPYIFPALLLLTNLLHCLALHRLLAQDDTFAKWSAYNKNHCRYLIVMGSALLINYRLFYLLVSGLWRVPVTCCQVSPLTAQKLGRYGRVLGGLGLVLVELPVIGYAIASIVLQKYYIANYKLFYGSLDVLVISTVGLIVTIAFVGRGMRFPAAYQKYILANVSNRSVPAVSEQQHEGDEQDEELNLHRSNSTEMLGKQSEEMRAVQYKSVFDPAQFEDPEFFEPGQIGAAINEGKFRKKNLRKKRKAYYMDNELDIIDEDSDQEQQKQKQKQRKGIRGKKTKLGFMNNFIYWKPPERGDPQKQQARKIKHQFKVHQKQIMEAIREKQSNFDTLTRNDIVFQDESIGSSNSSHESDPDFEIEDSRRALNFQYETFLNKNYARRRHLG